MLNADQSAIRCSCVPVPAEFCQQENLEGRPFRYGGDIRCGSLTRPGAVDFLVYRSVEGAHDGGGMKPCFLGAFSSNGEALWQVGSDGTQPARPGPVAVYDLDDDGLDEIICFFIDPHSQGGPGNMSNVVLQLRDGRTGSVLRESAPVELRECTGHGPNWVHQRLLVANLRGQETPRDLVVKVGDRLLAFDDQLRCLWRYDIRWTEYGRCPAYIPAVGDIDGDGRDEINGGYFLVNAEGEPLWERALAPHMDSVAIVPWDGGTVRAVCSGGGHVMDAAGNAVLQLGLETVPHGQEVRVGHFLQKDPDSQMALRYNAHTPHILLADTAGRIRRRLEINPTPNNTGMEPVYWNGTQQTAMLCNGGMLWDLDAGAALPLPELPEPTGARRQGWYHCVPLAFDGNARESLLLYNPWEPVVRLYAAPGAVLPDGGTGNRLVSMPRLYNARLMD